MTISRARSASSTESPNDQVEDVEDLLTVPGVAHDDRDMIWLWRLNAGTWDFLEPIGPAALRALGIRETVRQKYGGGSFKARVRSRGGKWGVSRQFSIEGDPIAAAASTPAAVAAAAAPSSSNMPDWVSKIVLPIAATLGTTLAAGLAKKLLESPQAPQLDPVLVKLLERVGRGDRPGEGDKVDMLRMMQLLRDAEDRGERRGRELGELAAGDGEGVTSAINQAAPLLHRMLDAADGRRARRALPSSPAMSPTAAPKAPTDIVPAWLRPFMPYKNLVLREADAAEPPVTWIAGMLIEKSDDATWAAIIEAEQAGRLETDILAAIPELQETEQRRAFATAVIAELRDEIAAARSEQAPPAAEAPADPPARSRKTVGRK